MGGKSAKLQKRIFPRSRTKLEVLQDKLTGKVNEYPSIPASAKNVKVDPVYTPQYSSLLKNIAGNIQSKDDNLRFKDFNMSSISEPQEPPTTPMGYIDKDLLTQMFIAPKDTPNLHDKFNLTEEELNKIFTCYTGFRIAKISGREQIEELLTDNDSGPVPLKDRTRGSIARALHNAGAKAEREVDKKRESDESDLLHKDYSEEGDLKPRDRTINHVQTDPSLR